MEFKVGLTLFLGVVMFSGLSFTQGYKFYVGGTNGWVVNPPEEYNHWAEHNRFQVNDTLLFKYEKSMDSVLVVTRDNYIHCYTKSPIQTLNDGNSEFKFDRSGPFYFISGNENHCKQGQKLIIVVLAVRQRKSPPSPIQPAPTPDDSTPSPSPSATVAPPPEAVPPESGEGESHSGSDNTPAPTPKSNFAGSRFDGSIGLATLCLGVLGAMVLLNN